MAAAAPSPGANNTTPATPSVWGTAAAATPTFAQVLLRSIQPPTVPVPVHPPATTNAGEPAIFFSAEEVKLSCKALDLAVIAKTPQGRPPFQDIRSHLTQRFKLQKDFLISALDGRHLLIRFKSEQDYYKVLLKDSVFVHGRLFKFAKWTMDFSPTKDSPLVPVWVQMPDLPANFYCEPMIRSIAGTIGPVLQIDLNTSRMIKTDASTVCIQMDVSKKLPDRVWVGIGATGRWQPLTYPAPPMFCTGCSRLGHTTKNCRQTNPGNKEKPARDAQEDHTQLAIPKATTWRPIRAGARPEKSCTAVQETSEPSPVHEKNNDNRLLHGAPNAAQSINNQVSLHGIYDSDQEATHSGVHNKENYEDGTPTPVGTHISSPVSIHAAPVKNKQPPAASTSTTAHKVLDGIPKQLHNPESADNPPAGKVEGPPRTQTLLPCNIQQESSLTTHKHSRHTHEESGSQHDSGNDTSDPGGKEPQEQLDTQKKQKGQDCTKAEGKNKTQPPSSKGVIIYLPVTHNVRAAPGLTPPEEDNLNNLHVAFAGKQKAQQQPREEGVRTRGGSRDAGFSGSKYTWYNGQQQNCIWTRIDHLFFNVEWAISCPALHVQHLSKACSDHCPLLISSTANTKQGPSRFTFQHMWCSHDKFIDDSAQAWRMAPTAGNPLLNITQKLKHMKLFYRKWNKEVFAFSDPMSSQLQTAFRHCPMNLFLYFLTNNNTHDTWIWRPTQNGKFSTRSVRTILTSEAEPHWAVLWAPYIPLKWSVLVWRILRDILPVDGTVKEKGVPLVSKCSYSLNPQEETTLHLFFTGNTASQIWSAMSHLLHFSNTNKAKAADSITAYLTRREPDAAAARLTRCTFMAILWEIWCSRNKARLQDQSMATRHITNRSMLAVRAICTAHKFQKIPQEWAAALGQGITDKDKLQARTPRVVRWSTPPLGRLKLNVDGAFRPVSGEAGGGGIIRDQNGTLCCAFAQTYDGLSSSLEAEALALRDGIAMCCRTGISDVMIETDSQNLLQIVTVQQTHQWDIASAGRTPSGGDGAVVRIPVASSGSPFFSVRHPQDAYDSPSGSSDPWVVTAKIGFSAWAEGRVLGSLQLDMAPHRRSQARVLVEQQGESKVPAQGQVQEEVTADESVAWPQGAAAAAGGQQQQEYEPKLQQYADWFPMAEQFFRAMYQGAWQPGQAAAGVQFPVPPPAVPEQPQVEPEVEQPERQQRSGTGSTRAEQQRTSVTEGRTALLERFLRLRPPMFHGEYDPDKAESWTHELERIFKTMECAEEDQRFSEVFLGEYFLDHARRSDQACAEKFIVGLRPDLRWGVTAHTCTTLGEAVAKATALDKETCSGLRSKFKQMSTHGGGRGKQQKRQSRFAEQSVVQGAE
ncbi:hypothetical protein Taro_003350 [Colocasia esculenta]|uniref:RNase H type-1 domain-containing protein n=1 Tax=Colocasia esculenta TaxID=4460 RepID=A0A843TNK3_COLES|nr:hypothetical protein [Colocasia esculenta]